MANNSIGDNIRNLRLALGLNQKEFADLISFSEAIVSRVENGKREATAQFIQRICDTFHAKPHIIYNSSCANNRS